MDKMKESAQSKELQEVPEPPGQFILDNGPEPVQGGSGAYYHYSDVCKLLEKYRQESEARLLGRMASKKSAPAPEKEREYLEQVNKCLESLAENAAHSFRVPFYELNLAMIETSRRLKELKPPEKHYVIIGADVGEPIGCCPESGLEHVKREEPKARFEEVDPERCPVCNAPEYED